MPGGNKVGSSQNSPVWVDAPETSSQNQAVSRVGKTPDQRDVFETSPQKNLQESEPHHKSRWKRIFDRMPKKLQKAINFLANLFTKNKSKPAVVTSPSTLTNSQGIGELGSQRSSIINEPPSTFSTFQPSASNPETDTPVMPDESAAHEEPASDMPLASEEENSGDISLPGDSMNLHASFFEDAGEFPATTFQNQLPVGDPEDNKAESDIPPLSEDIVEIPASELNRQSEVVDTSLSTPPPSPPAPPFIPDAPPPPGPDFIASRRGKASSESVDTSAVNKNPELPVSRPLRDTSDLMQSIRDAGGTKSLNQVSNVPAQIKEKTEMALEMERIRLQSGLSQDDDELESDDLGDNLPYDDDFDAFPEPDNRTRAPSTQGAVDSEVKKKTVTATDSESARKAQERIAKKQAESIKNGGRGNLLEAIRNRENIKLNKTDTNDTGKNTQSSGVASSLSSMIPPPQDSDLNEPENNQDDGDWDD